MKLEFVVERETKGAILYKQVKDGKDFTIADGAEIGSFYMRKSAYPNGHPQAITVTVE
jgi:hypothetical protein